MLLQYKMVDREALNLTTNIVPRFLQYGNEDIFSHVNWTVQEELALEESSYKSVDAMYEELHK